MQKSNKIVKGVMVTLVSAALTGGTVAATAASKYVKCYGIAKKGKNDCGNNRHACAGQATKNNAPDEWVYAMKSSCLKKGGSVNKPKS